MTQVASNPLPQPPTEPESYRYDAFISYRHVEPDRSWAKWLHHALETYRPPKKLLARPGIAKLSRRVFRDEEELPASADLSSQIDQALVQSRYLIVICSPKTPESLWVNAEIKRFRAMGRDDRILALLVDGEPNVSFPRPLCEMTRRTIDGSGKLVETVVNVEPLAADVRPSKHEKPRAQKQAAKLRFMACMLGCHYDDLRQREQLRQQRRIKMIAGALAVAVAGTSTLAAWAMYQRTLAVRAQHYAETQRDLAIEALNTLVFEAHEKLEDRAGTRQLQDALLQSALEKLKRVNEGSDAEDGRVDLSAAVALKNRAQLLVLAGRTADAEKVLERSLEMLRDGKLGSGPETKRALADSLHVSGLCRQRAGDTKGAKARFEESLSVREALVKSDPRSAPLRGELGDSYDYLGDLAASSGDAKTAVRFYERSLAEREAWRKLDPKNDRAERAVAVSLTSLGDMWRVLGDMGAAVESFDKAQAIFEKIAAADAYNAAAQRFVAISYNKRAFVRTAIGDLTHAKADYAKALEIITALAASDRGNGEWQRELAVCLNNLSDVSVRLGDAAAAEQYQKRAVQIAADWAAADEKNAEAQRQWANALQGMGVLRQRMSQWSEAAASLEQAAKIRQKLIDTDPASAENRRDMAILRDRLGDLALAQGHKDEAIAAYEQALKLREELAKADASNVEAQRDLSVSFNRMGKASEPSEAVKWYGRSVELRRKLANLDEGNPEAQGDLAGSLHLLGNAYTAAKQLHEALAAYLEAMSLFEQLAQANPAETAQRMYIAECGAVANTQFQLEQKAAAAKTLKAAGEAAKRTAMRHTASTEWPVTAIQYLTRAADLMAPAEAVTLYESALELVKKLEAEGKLSPQQAGWRANLEAAVKRCRTSA